MFDTPALMQALEDFKVRAIAPLPPMSERLLEEAWHGSILHDTVCNAEAHSSDEEGGRSSDEEIAVDSEDGSESDDDADGDEDADVQGSAEEEESDDEMVKIVKHSFVVYTTLYHRFSLVVLETYYRRCFNSLCLRRLMLSPSRHLRRKTRRLMQLATKLSLPRSIPFTSLSQLMIQKSRKTSHLRP